MTCPKCGTKCKRKGETENASGVWGTVWDCASCEKQYWKPLKRQPKKKKTRTQHLDSGG